MGTETEQPDSDKPETFTPGTVLHYIPSGELYTVRGRKDDGSGWWLDDVNGDDAGGIDDRVYRSTGQWEVAGPGPDRDDDEIAEVGFDIENLAPEDVAEMAALMHDSNESRVAALEEKAGPNNAGSLENAFDALRMLVFLEQIAAKLEISEVCALDFEGRRASMLTKIEETYSKMLAARQAAERAARLAGGGGPVLRQVPGSPPGA